MVLYLTSFSWFSNFLRKKTIFCCCEILTFCELYDNFFLLWSLFTYPSDRVDLNSWISQRLKLHNQVHFSDTISRRSNTCDVYIKVGEQHRLIRVSISVTFLLKFKNAQLFNPFYIYDFSTLLFFNKILLKTKWLDFWWFICCNNSWSFFFFVIRELPFNFKGEIMDCFSEFEFFFRHSMDKFI